MKTALRTLTILLLITLITVSCSEKKSIKQANSFEFPDIVDTLQKADYYYSPALITMPCNSIKTIERVGNKANLVNTKDMVKYFIDYHHSADTSNKSVIARTGLSIFVDTTREVSIDKNEWNPPPPFYYPTNDNTNLKSKSQKLNDSLFSVSLQSWESYHTSFVKGFPVYIVNNSNHPVRVNEQDGRFMIIQEALDKKGQWKPLKFWQYASCGNANGSIAILPNYYAMTEVYKYKGTFETMLRLKMLNDSVIYYSQPFKGSINLTQFDTSLVEHEFGPSEFFIIDKR